MTDTLPLELTDEQLEQMDAVFCDRDAEDALLGSVLINPNILDEIEMNSDDFYLSRNQIVWGVIIDLWGKGIVPDFVTLTNRLDNNKIWKEIPDGVYWLGQLLSMVPSSLHAHNYAAIIKVKARRRKLISAANKLANVAYNKSDDVLDNAVVEVIDDLVRQSCSVKEDGPVSIKEVVSELYDDVEEKSKNPNKVWGIPTGFMDYDNALGGIQKSEVLYIAGIPGVGKSIFAAQIGLNAAKNNHPGAVFSLEMSNMMITRRLVSSMGEIETWRLKSGDLGESDWTKFVHACEITGDLPIYVCDIPDLTTNQLHSYLSKLKSVAGIEWFILDYLALMGDQNKSDNERMEYISRRVVSSAKRLNIAGITVNSVTKEIMDGLKRPTQKDVRGPGSLIHDANVIMFLTEHEPRMGPPNSDYRTCIISKVRDEDCPKATFDIQKTHGYPGFVDIHVKHEDLLDYTR
jgi:replicative DNA helicase